MGGNALNWYPVDGGKLIHIGYKYDGGSTGITVPADEAVKFATEIINTAWPHTKTRRKDVRT